MPISQKIIDRVKVSTTSVEEQKLMMRILQIEDKGVFRFDAEYEKAIKEFIAKRDEEVTN